MIPREKIGMEKNTETHHLGVPFHSPFPIPLSNIHTERDRETDIGALALK